MNGSCNILVPVISDLDHFGLGDFGRLSVISDSDFGLRFLTPAKSDCDFGWCAVNSDAQKKKFFVTLFALILVITDGDFER